LRHFLHLSTDGLDVEPAILLDEALVGRAFLVGQFQWLELLDRLDPLSNCLGIVAPLLLGQADLTAQ